MIKNYIFFIKPSVEAKCDDEESEWFCRRCTDSLPGAKAKHARKEQARKTAIAQHIENTENTKFKLNYDVSFFYFFFLLLIFIDLINVCFVLSIKMKKNFFDFIIFFLLTQLFKKYRESISGFKKLQFYKFI